MSYQFFVESYMSRYLLILIFAFAFSLPAYMGQGPRNGPNYRPPSDGYEYQGPGLPCSVNEGGPCV
jgi:hypothetical protein